MRQVAAFEEKVRKEQEQTAKHDKFKNFEE